MSALVGRVLPGRDPDDFPRAVVEALTEWDLEDLPEDLREDLTEWAGRFTLWSDGQTGLAPRPGLGSFGFRPVQGNWLV